MESTVMKRRKTSKYVKYRAQYGKPNPRRIYEVQTDEKYFLKFTDRKAFGSFCVKLKTARVAFELVGFQTVVIAKGDFDNLVITSAQAYKEYQKYSPPYTFFLLNGDMELNRNWHLFI